MENIETLFHLDIGYFIMSCFGILFAVVTAIEIIGKFSEYVGKPLKWIRNRSRDHESVEKIAERLDALELRQTEDAKISNENDRIITDKLDHLSQLFLDYQIDTMRWEIINTADKISDGKTISREAISHCIHTYEKYEQIINENGLKNGEVELSMEMINNYCRKYGWKNNN